MAWSERQLKVPGVLVAMILAATGCPTPQFVGAQEQAFHPASHDVGVDLAAIAAVGLRGGYRQFDRDAIVAAIQSNDVYGPVIAGMRNQVEQLVQMSDDELRSLIPAASTIRALMVNTAGCPVHGGGTRVYAPFGIRTDISHPLGVRCPIGGEVYPNEEFPDDGSGWLDERPGSDTQGQRFYFVGWFNHWFLRWLPDKIETMARLWFILDDERYAHTATVLLERLMEVYPDMDRNDLTYDGSDWGIYVKMLPTMWEGDELVNLVDGVELMLPLLDDDFLQRFHTSVFRPAFEAYRQQPAPSNWGGVWNAPFARFAMITGDQEILDYMLHEHPAAIVPTLDNQFFRDGFPYEAAFTYGSHYLYAAQDIADALGERGEWIWAHPRMQRSFETYADLIILDKFTHFYGDTGGIYNRGLTLRPALLEEAAKRYSSPKIARYLRQAYDVHGSSRSSSIESEFSTYEHAGIEADEGPAEGDGFVSTLAPVKGVAIMRTGVDDDRAALYFDYGYAHAAHSHADRLNINLFAYDREFLPEMGYPEYMDSVQPTPGGWTTHTASHITVEVNEKRQLEGVFGDLHGFVHGEWIKYVDASCEDAYVHADVDLYRRSLALIDIPGGAYVVDMFRVRGGQQHDYLFHGPPVEVTLRDIDMSEPRRGTLAGHDVAFGAKPDSVLPYHVDNKGYQYLFDVRQGTADGPYHASWKMADGVSFWATFLPAEGEQFYLTSGFPRPSSKKPPPMPFLVRRRSPAADGDLSLFASVLSYTRDTPPVIGARRLALTPDSDNDAIAILVEHLYGEDVVMSCLSPSGFASSADGRFELHGQFGAVSIRKDTPPRMMLVGGTSFSADNRSITLEGGSVSATVREVYDDRLVLDRPLPEWVVGEILLAMRGPVESSYRVEKIEGDTVYVSPGTWIGKGRADRYDRDTATIFDSRDVFPLGEKRNRLADISGMVYPEGNRNYYAGSWLVAEDGTSHYRLKSGGFPGFVLDPVQDLSRIEQRFSDRKPFLLYDLGPGDTVKVLRWKQG
jgi:hypothetical protein